MPDLRPHIDKYPGWSWSGKIDNSKFEKFQDLWQQPPGTYRGDLFPLKAENFEKGIIHEAKKQQHHEIYPHYNILFHDKVKAAIIIPTF